MAEKPRDSCVLPMHLRIIYPVSHDSMSIDHETENFSFKKKNLARLRPSASSKAPVPSLPRRSAALPTHG